VLAEIVRINSHLPYAECEELINSIVQRKTPIVFDTGKARRVLDTTLSASDKVLILLYHSGVEIDAETLRSWIEYRNPTHFKKILRELHTNRLIEYDGITCLITPKGIQETEELLTRTRRNNGSKN